MFWNGRVSILTQLDAFLRQNPVELWSPKESHPGPVKKNRAGGCSVTVGSVDDSLGISRLLNEWFETGNVKTTTSMDWVRYSYLQNSAIWIVAKDSGGTIRGCISSFRISAPYPNSLLKCGESPPWGLVDWFCVHPLWRQRGVASRLLETLDSVTYDVGRKAHVFLKEGIPLAFPNIPVYSTTLRCRKAGTSKVNQMREGTGLCVHDYHCVEQSTQIPMVRVEGLQATDDLAAWEDALDTELPECWVFVSGSDKVDPTRGWKTDSVVSMYAFRWTPGKWWMTPPSREIV